MKKIEIKIKNGKWLVNGKCYLEASYVEKEFLRDFFKSTGAGSIPNKLSRHEIRKPIKKYIYKAGCFLSPISIFDTDFDKLLSDINVTYKTVDNGR